MPSSRPSRPACTLPPQEAGLAALLAALQGKFTHIFVDLCEVRRGGASVLNDLPLAVTYLAIPAPRAGDAEYTVRYSRTVEPFLAEEAAIGCFGEGL